MIKNYEVRKRKYATEIIQKRFWRLLEKYKTLGLHPIYNRDYERMEVSMGDYVISADEPGIYESEDNIEKIVKRLIKKVKVIEDAENLDNVRAVFTYSMSKIYDEDGRLKKIYYRRDEIIRAMELVLPDANYAILADDDGLWVIMNYGELKRYDKYYKKRFLEVAKVWMG